MTIMTNTSEANCPPGHVVQFYENDEYLVDKVSEFIRDGLAEGANAVIIAKERHLTALKQSLRGDVTTASENASGTHGNCLFLNAMEVLTKFMVDSWPDERRFNEVADGIFAQLGTNGARPVRAFGEMVSILCEEGNVLAAIRLEELWNKLASRHSFHLLCAYSINDFSEDVTSTAFHSVCAQHACVCPAEHPEPPDLASKRVGTLARLQQKTRALEFEVERRKRVEQVLNERERVLSERTAALSLANERLQREIERRKLSEQELLHAQNVLTIAQKVAHLGSWEIDTASEELHCSDEYFRICGLKPQSRRLSIESVLDMVHPDDREESRQAIQAARENLASYSIEKRIIRPDGSIRYVVSEGHTIVDGEGNPLAVIGSFLDITERKQAEEALRKLTEDLRHLGAYQERIKEEERARIAREVHDELGSVLTCLKAYVAVSMERSAKAGIVPDVLLGEASSLADIAIETIRRIITDLRPSVLDELGVWAALEWYAEQVSIRTGLTCHCTIAKSALAISLDRDRSTMLFRIVQESLTNIVRHAAASVITVGVTRVDECIILEIEDDGKGIDASSLLEGKSWGIHGMYERARHFGGELSISGRPGQGTTVRLTLPLEL